MVDGRPVIEKFSCVQERYVFTECGAEAKLFEQKRGD